MNKYIRILLFTSLCIKFTFNKKYLFSVIISIYNTGRYLNESIGSILNQTIPFCKIQIILVNDGSTDETEEICLKYKKKFPNNIKYIKIKHSGVSIGRNIGMKYAEGEFINFLDADDKWDSLAFKLVFLFFRFYKSINIIGCRIIFFELLQSFHPLDYKFNNTRIVNLTKEYNCIHLSSSSSFFRYSLIKNKKFKKGIFNGEDTRFINNFLLKNPKMGLIREAIYYYRKRRDSTSAIQNKEKNEGFYFSIIKLVDQYLLNKSKKLYNIILPFIQFYISYNTLYRIILPSSIYLGSSKFISYCKLIDNLIKQVEDKYILEQHILSLNEKFCLLSRKYERDVRNDIIFQNGMFIYSGFKLFSLKENNTILIFRILEIKNNILHLEGRDNFFLSPETYFYYCKLNNKIIYPEYYDYSSYDVNVMYGKIHKGRIVLFDIPIENSYSQTIYFFISYKGKDSEIFPSLGMFTHIPDIFGGYYHHDDYILQYYEGRINIFKYNKTIEELFENEYCEQLQIINKSNLIKLRNNSFQFRKEKKDDKFIWIINDKLTSAGDNGEYFFRFLKMKNPKNIDFYFVIKSNCSDYKRLESLGNIIDFKSEYYLDIFLRSDKIISSIFEAWVDNPFEKDFKYIRDLIHFDYVFIQQGIIKDDLTSVLNKISKNYQFIITSSKKEYNSIIKKKYGYNKNNVILTGLPRYDNLYKLKDNVNKEKIILIMPTWRKYIKGTYNYKTFESIYSSNFNLTNFFNFYNNLINNDELLLNMEKFKYKGIFCLHPYFSKQWKDFKQNKIFSIMEIFNYQNLLLKSSLLITDYSSIFFDFGYLAKPVIYTHFDYNEYRHKHFNKGSFDYLKQGFGPICYDINCTINNIVLQMKKHCSIEKKYLKRINKYFKYIDANNCERLYLALVNNSFQSINGNKKSVIFIIIIFSILIIFKFNLNLI